MPRVYDNWERLVEAVLKREHLRQLVHCESFSSSISGDLSSRLSLSSSLEYFSGWIDEHTLTASRPGSGMAIAIKEWIEHSMQGRQEWMNEIHYLSQLHHPNLVRLIGYCNKEERLFLVYEFMPKGSLDNHLFRRGHQSLPWKTRIEVAIGAARGLSFLHDREIQVMHQFFKSRDILLDGEFNAKLSYFTYAKYDPTVDSTCISPRAMRKYVYAAPEHMLAGHLTTKSDVYGFGVVLLEVLSGRRALDLNNAREEQMLVEWAKPYMHDKRKLPKIMDATLEGQNPLEAAYAVATLASRCLSIEAKSRPQMTEVLVLDTISPY